MRPLAEFSSYFKSLTRQAGPETPTILEKIVSPLPGTYFSKIVVFWVIFGTPGMVASRYLDTFNTEAIVSLFGVVSLQNVLVFSLANFVMPLYAFYGVRHMRLKISETIPEFKRMATDEASAEKSGFQSITKFLPSLALAGLIAVVSLVSFPGQTQHVVGYLSLVVKVVGFAISMLGYGTFIWMYSSSIYSLHQLGQKRLRFTSFLEDKHLGMECFGSVSLSLVWVYFLGIGLVFFSFSPLPATLLIVLGGLIVFGVTLFFLPLHTVHSKMANEKQAAEKALRIRIHQLSVKLESGKALGDFTDLAALQIWEQKVSRISEWPFDIETLSWLSAIIISVVAAVITKYLLVFVE